MMHDIAPTRARRAETRRSLGTESTDTHTCVTVHTHAHTLYTRTYTQTPRFRLFSWCTDFPREFPMQGGSSVTQSGWTRTADPREFCQKSWQKSLAKTDLAKRDLAKILAKILGKKNLPRISWNNLRGNSPRCRAGIVASQHAPAATKVCGTSSS